jgi:hypothetical protein
MGKPKEIRQPAPEGSITLILDDFLIWTSENRSKDTADRYQDFLQSFVAKHASFSFTSFCKASQLKNTFIKDRSLNET